ncbi:MAG: tetratricopeptide repeat protein, partial [Deltaproteobacteria bacterium]
MINKDNGFDLNIRWRFPGGREYTFAFIALFAFLIVAYSNSFQGQFVFDDTQNIVKSINVHLKSLNWPDIKNTFYGIEGKRIDRPLAFFSFALNYYFHKLNVFGYHVVNFAIHYLPAILLFLSIYNTLKLLKLREQYGHASYSIALLATFFWATSPLQVTAVTYIVQRMASMTGLFYIMAMYFYLKGRTANRYSICLIYFALCTVSAVMSLGTKENAVLLPVSIWLYDLIMIQAITRENLIRNLKVFAPVILIVTLVGLWYVDFSSILSGAAYANRPFTLIERLLTEPRIAIFYITLLLYPLGSRLTLLHDIELSTSLIAPWTTIPAIALILGLISIALYLARRSPFISFAILFYFLNHAMESTFIPLELIYEHRNYIPSMFFFVPVAIAMIHVLDYFSYKNVIQYSAVAVFTFLMFAQGHTVFERNALFSNPLLLWTDNVIKSPKLSRPYNELGNEYWNLGRYGEAYEFYSLSVSLAQSNNVSMRGVSLCNLGIYHLRVAKDHNRALEYFRAAMVVYPGHWQSYQEAAVCFILNRDLSAAGKTLAPALSRWPDNAELRQTHGLLMLKAGKYDQAINEARQALAIDPNQYDALSVLGEAFRRKGDMNTATLYWKKYSEKQPNNLQAYLALVELYAYQDKNDNLSRTIGRL